MDEVNQKRPAARLLKVPRGYFGELLWAGSLLLKCVVLGVGVVVVWWAGWPQPVSLPSHAHAIHSPSDNQVHDAGRVTSPREREMVQSVGVAVNGIKGQTGKVAAVIVDLNDGTSDELAHLPGIGSVLAGRIVAHRVSHGAFRRVEDVVLVPGIGEKRFQQLRPFIGVREPTSRIGMAS